MNSARQQFERFGLNEAPRRQTPRWVVTYADMISLLVTFFIMLMTYSSMEQEMYAKMTGSILGAFGVISDENTPNHESFKKPSSSIADRVPEGGLRTSRRDLERVEEGLVVLVQRPDHGVRIDFERTQHGIRIRIVEDFPYASGDARLSEPSKRALRQLADVLRVHVQRVRVAGHSFAEGLDRDGAARDPLEISLQRALTAADYLRETGRLPEVRLEVAAHGDTRPWREGDDENTRQQNRRIEIWVLPLVGESAR